MAFDFKKEEDVKDYIDNLGIEYRFSCYQEKNAEGEIFIQRLLFKVIFLLKLSFYK